MKRVVVLVGLAFAVLAFTGGTALAEDHSQTSIVTAQGGGGIIADNGLMQWYVPAGAYAYDLKIKYTQKTRSHFPGDDGTYKDLILAAEPFTLDINVLDGGEGIDLDKNMTLSIKYDPVELGGRGESGLRVARFDGAYNQWFPIPSTVDTANHIVTTTETNEAGDYGLIVYNVPPTPATAPASDAPAPASSPVPTPVPVPAVPMSSGITGRVFYDKNGNGIMDGDDFPIVGAGLKISSGTWSALTTTDASGNYAFWDLRESAYNVELVVGPEWAFTSPNAVSGIWVTGYPDSKGTADFGMWYRLQ